jgi:hypothetical protein
MPCEPGPVFALDDCLFAQEAMLDRIPRDDGFALGRPRTGGPLGIGTIGFDLGFGSHEFPSAFQS